MQLRGRARSPEDRTKALRNLAGIKEEPKKKEEKEKKKPTKGKETAPAAESARGKGREDYERRKAGRQTRAASRAKRSASAGEDSSERNEAAAVSGCRHRRASPGQARRRGQGASRGAQAGAVCAFETESAPREKGPRPVRLR